MKALLLIGGLATRLLPLSKYMPKSLLPVCDREILHYQVTQLALAGINEIVLAAGHRVEQLREYVEAYSGGLHFHFSIEPEPRGTAGAIAEARELVGGERLVVLNADIISAVTIGDVIKVHEQQGAPATIVGFGVDDPTRYGLLNVRDNELLGFSEKPEGNLGPGPHYINAGIYVLEPAAYRDIPGGQAVSIERQTFPRLLSEHGKLAHFAHEGLWIDIGTFESYFQANFALLARRYAGGEDWLWGPRDDCAVFKDLIYLSKSARLGAGVDLFHRVIVMRDGSIGEHCRLQNVVVMPQARIGNGCQLSDCIIGPGAEVADGSRTANAVVVAGEDITPFYPQAQLAS
jgi:mannose-1-phosphate guanylyltransferase